MKFRLMIVYLFFSCISLQAQDTLQQMQELYNGSIWIDYLSVLKGDQFLFTWAFRPGSVSLRGKTYPARLRYDIYEDQIQIPAGRYGILQINKELVDSFSLTDDGRTLKFVRLPGEGSRPFYQLLYFGNISLYASYNKKIDKLNAGGEVRGFYQINRIYLVKNDDFLSIGRKKDLVRAMSDRKSEVRDYIRKNRLRITPSNPESFVPAVRYYDSLTR